MGSTPASGGLCHRRRVDARLFDKEQEKVKRSQRGGQKCPPIFCLRKQKRDLINTGPLNVSCFSEEISLICGYFLS